MARIPFAFVMLLAFAVPAHATGQVQDSIVVGGKTYGMFQIPMTGYWRHEEEEPDDREPMPPFEFQSSANWRGYVAQFSIANGRLYLRSIQGRLGGKDVADRDIIDRRFPLPAHWYTGSIFISVGGYDESSKRFRYVIEFEIERGKVVETRYRDSRKIPTTWNGRERPPESPLPAELENEAEQREPPTDE